MDVGSEGEDEAERKVGGRKGSGWPVCFWYKACLLIATNVSLKGEAPAHVTEASEHQEGQRAVYKSPTFTCKVFTHILIA